MITQEQFDNLQPGDILKHSEFTLEICARFHKVVLTLDEFDDITFYTLDELNKLNCSKVKPIQYNQGFEIREYPERPVVLVGNTEAEALRFLVEVREDTVICVSDFQNRFSTNSGEFTKWKLIKKVD